MNLRAAVANLAWLAASRPAHARFTRALREPEAAQERWLQRHLQRNAASAYGRAHGAGEIRSYADFARRLPVLEPEALGPWVARLRRGESNVLGADPVTRLMPTSGSAGAGKLIPYTRSLQREFNQAIGPWLVDLCRQAPRLPAGPAYWSVTPAAPAASVADSRIPIGFADDREYLGGARAWLLAGAMAVPSAVRHLADLGTFRHVVLRHLLAAPDLRLISVWHPSFLALLLDTLTRDWDALLARSAPALSPRRRRDVERAGPNPAGLWPHLQLVSCWADGHAAGPAAELQRRLPGVTLQPKGLLATEAFVTLPFRGAHPLALCSHFFEFADERGGVVPVAGLRPGGTYDLIVTTGGGLWRYRLGDRVEVTGRVDRAPALRFVGRGTTVSDRCGEKLAEAFVAGVLGRLCPLARFALLAPEAHDRGWRYVLFLEGAAPHHLAAELDAALGANPHYAECRRLGQLAPARIVVLSHDGFSCYGAAERARGRRLGDLKPVALSARDDWGPWFAAPAESPARARPASSR